MQKTTRKKFHIFQNNNESDLSWAMVFSNTTRQFHLTSGTDENVFCFFKTDFWIDKKAFSNFENGRDHVLLPLRMALDWLEYVHQFEEFILNSSSRER